MEEPKYLFANIKIPIEIKKNGSIEPMKEYITIEFTNCNELPPKSTSETNYSSVLNTLKNIINTEPVTAKECESGFDENEEIKEPEHILVLKSEIKNGVKNKNNTSFKSNPRKIHRYTVRNN